MNTFIGAFPLAQFKSFIYLPHACVTKNEAIFLTSDKYQRFWASALHGYTSSFLDFYIFHYRVTCKTATLMYDEIQLRNCEQTDKPTLQYWLSEYLNIPNDNKASFHGKQTDF